MHTWTWVGHIQAFQQLSKCIERLLHRPKIGTSNEILLIFLVSKWDVDDVCRYCNHFEYNSARANIDITNVYCRLMNSHIDAIADKQNTHTSCIIHTQLSQLCMYMKFWKTQAFLSICKACFFASIYFPMQKNQLIVFFFFFYGNAKLQYLEQSSCAQLIVMHFNSNNVWK